MSSSHHYDYYTHMPKMPRTLVLCFDGTADEFDEDNSNVVKLFSLLKKGDEDKQLCYYQSGIGTYFKPGVVSPLFRRAASVLDFAVAWYLDEHVCDGYKFLMQNYREGDKICLFGFSRGAYIARALAGFLNKCGLLLRDNDEQVMFAYKLYKRTDSRGVKLATSFKHTYCREVPIEFVGVWDTVASVGIFNNRTLPFTTSNDAIRTFRHALSLDEHRAKFRPNVWHRPTPVNQETGRTMGPDGPPPPPPSPSPSRNSIASEVLGLIFHPHMSSAPETAPASLENYNKSPLLPLPSPGDSSVLSGRASPERRGRRRTRAPSLPEPTISDQPTVAGDSAKTEDHDDTGAELSSPHTKPPISNPSRPSRWASTSAKVKRIIRAKKSLEHTRNLEEAHGDDIPVISHESEPTYVDDGTAGKARDKSFEPDVLEVWFSGVHADVGGGSLPNGAKRSLSNITLRWMVREIVTSQCGIIFNHHALRRAGVQTSLLGSPTRAGVQEKALDRKDLGAPIVDQMKTKAGIMWWLLELVPISETWQEKSGHWKRRLSINLGQGRRIPETDQPPNFHFTVRERMQDPKLNYRPRARWIAGTEIYVE